MATIKVKSIDEIIHILEKRVSRIKQVAILSDIGQYMVKEVTDRFKHNKIKPKTSVQTLLNRRAKGYKKIKHAKKQTTRNKLLAGSITLVDTGDLMRSIQYKVKERKKQVIIGTNLVYASIHQFGGRTGINRKTKLPARPYLYYTSVNRIRIKQIIKAHIEET